MTEEEAKTRPCIGPNPMNTGWLTAPNEQGVSVFVCRGSVCMAWRWNKERPSLRVKNVAGEEFLVTPEAYNREWRGAEFTTEPAHGYCGLSGPPVIPSTAAPRNAYTQDDLDAEAMEEEAMPENQPSPWLMILGLLVIPAAVVLATLWAIGAL